MPGKTLKKIEKVQEELNESVPITPPSSDGETNTSFSTTDSDKSSIQANKLPYDKETYVLKFGIFKGRRAADVVNDFKMKENKQTDEMYRDRVGLKYLRFLLDKCEWLHPRDKATISQIVKEYKY